MERLIERILKADPQSLASMLRASALAKRDASRIRDDAMPIPLSNREEITEAAWGSDQDIILDGYTFITDSGLNIDLLFFDSDSPDIRAFQIRLGSKKLRRIALDPETGGWKEIPTNAQPEGWEANAPIH